MDHVETGTSSVCSTVKKYIPAESYVVFDEIGIPKES